MSTVRLQGVSKSFAETVILEGVDLTVNDREFMVIVGPSGCGKTTLLRLIAGLETITAGDLWIDGVHVNDVAPARRGLALVFQSYALYPHMTVEENMAFSLKLAGVPKPERRKKVEEAARILHLEAFLDRKPKELSGGRASTSPSAAPSFVIPRSFSAIRPLSNLDTKLRGPHALELMKLHKQLHATIIYVTHDQTEAMTMADRIVVMQGGASEQIRSPLEVYLHPVNRFVAGSIGSPKMNFLRASVMEAQRGERRSASGTVTALRFLSAGRCGPQIEIGRHGRVRHPPGTHLTRQCQRLSRSGQHRGAPWRGGLSAHVDGAGRTLGNQGRWRYACPGGGYRH